MLTYWDNKALPTPNPTRYLIFNFSIIFIENKCFLMWSEMWKGTRKSSASANKAGYLHLVQIDSLFSLSVVYFRVVYILCTSYIIHVVTSDVVKLVFIALFLFHVCYHDGVYVCVNGTVHLLYMLVFFFSACGKATCNGLWFIMWLSHHHLLLVVISVLQSY